jgi:hypothetical protein
MANKTAYLNIRISEEARDKLKAKAWKLGKTYSEILTSWIEDFVADERDNVKGCSASCDSFSYTQQTWEEQIQEYLELAIPRFQKDLKLSTWNVRWKVEQIEETGESKCKVNPTYYTLDLWFDPDKIRDKEHLKYTVVHELIHAIIGQYEISCDCAVNQLDPQAREVIEQMLFTELERTVTHLERVIAPSLNDQDLEVF